MITCPVCGAQNDPSNRFCDQCGALLDSTHAAAATLVSPPPAATTITCPECNTTALPGQAFCDNCGFDLRTVSIPAASKPVSPDTATVVSPPQAIAPDEATQTAPDPAADVETVIAPQSSPSVSSASGTTPTASAEETLIVSPSAPPAATPDEETLLAPTPAPAPTSSEATPTPTPAPAPMPTPTPSVEHVAPAPAPSEATPTPAPMPTPTPSVEHVAPAPGGDEATPAPGGDEATPAPTPSPAPSVSESVPPAHHPQRQDIEEEIGRHRASIVQMEQMIQAYPPGSAPDYLVKGLESARSELKQAEDRLSALSSTPAPDPAEVEQLQKLIKAHQDTIKQFQAMKSTYPAGSVPLFIEDGIKQAQDALTQAESDLAALHGGVMPPAVPNLSSQAADSEALLPPRPRLILEGNHEIALIDEKQEFIIGREDPVSHIFPEIDLTSFGGEAGGVSRQHARINRSSDQWTISDLNSTNHTRVDGNRIEPDTPTPIKDGTRLQFGRVPAIFRL